MTHPIGPSAGFVFELPPSGPTNVSRTAAQSHVTDLANSDSRPASDSSAPAGIAVARPIHPDSWLETRPEFRWLLDGLTYAATQTQAIWALDKCSPEEVAHVVMAVMRGAGIALLHEADSCPPAPSLAEKIAALKGFEVRSLGDVWKAVWARSDAGFEDADEAVRERLRELLGLDRGSPRPA